MVLELPHHRGVPDLAVGREAITAAAATCNLHKHVLPEHVSFSSVFVACLVCNFGWADACACKGVARSRCQGPKPTHQLLSQRYTLLILN